MELLATFKNIFKTTSALLILSCCFLVGLLTVFKKVLFCFSFSERVHGQVTDLFLLSVCRTVCMQCSAGTF